MEQADISLPLMGGEMRCLLGESAVDRVLRIFILKPPYRFYLGRYLTRLSVTVLIKLEMPLPVLRQRTKTFHSSSNENLEYLKECGKHECFAVNFIQNTGELPNVALCGGQIVEAEFRGKETDGTP